MDENQVVFIKKIEGYISLLLTDDLETRDRTMLRWLVRSYGDFANTLLPRIPMVY